MNRKAVFTLLRACRDWRPLIASLAIAATIGLVLGRNSTSAIGFVAYYGPPLIAISVIGGLFEYAQRGSVWLLVAQRPGSEAARLWSLLGFAGLLYLCASAIVLAGALSGVALNDEYTPIAQRAAFVVFPLWAVMIGFAVATTTTLVRTRSAGVSLAWVMSPFIVALAQGSLGFSDTLLHALEFLMPPQQAVFQFGAVLRGDRPEQALRFSAQLVSFPILCLAVIRWRISVLSKPDRIRVE